MTQASLDLPFVHNHVAAAQQDYDLAKGEHATVLDTFDATDERTVGRYHAAQARLEQAPERWLEAMR